ncbi:MAG: flagellar hook-length control protein FliK [Lachnospiraceae bacterium]|nr:flagellar hook-length control protein FliK [Lachnospiraceae bacterium]
MNIQVNNSGLYQTGSNVNVSTQSAEAVSQAAEASLIAAKNVINVKAGDVFSGQIVDMTKDGIASIMLKNNAMLKAQISAGLSVEVGQILSFQVKGATKSSVTLTPLYANLDNNSAVAKALNAAELPVTAQNADMVKAMMERGLPIDKGSLQGMANLAARYPTANPASIVQMTQLGIPLTDGNVQQFEAYKEGQYKIAESLSPVAEGFAEMAGESTAMNRSVAGIFLEAPAPELTEAVIKAFDGDQTKLLNMFNIEISEAENSEQVNEANLQQTDAGKVETSAENTGKTEIPAENENAEKNVEVIKPDPEYAKPGAVGNDLIKLIGSEGAGKIAELMNKAGFPEQLTARIASGELTPKQTLELIQASIEGKETLNFKGEEAQATIRELISSEPYKFILRNQITSNLLLNPDDVADQEKVQEYYQKLGRVLSEASELVKTAGRGESTLAQSVDNLNSNVDFINGLNAAMTYIQLPLKLNDMASHGDLYVYTNKKKLAEKDGNCSALLHLDMEHLGTVDVHVTMKDYDKVTTHFILQEESLLDFIAKYLPELDKSLENRGYHMHSDVSLNKEAKSVPELMFNKGSNAKLIQKTSFDVRA